VEDGGRSGGEDDGGFGAADIDSRPEVLGSHRINESTREAGGRSTGTKRTGGKTAGATRKTSPALHTIARAVLGVSGQNIGLKADAAGHRPAPRESSRRQKDPSCCVSQSTSVKMKRFRECKLSAPVLPPVCSIARSGRG
jgi:hypothetical protein